MPFQHYFSNITIIKRLQKDYICIEEKMTDKLSAS